MVLERKKNMGEIVVPDFGPPQIEANAKETIANRILELGLNKVYDECLDLMFLRLPLLADSLESQKFVFKGKPVNNPNVGRAFRVGAVVSAQAYNLSGFDQSLDRDLFTVASMEAELEGVPQVFACRAQEDFSLQDLVGLISDAPDLIDDELAESQRYQKVVALGAGLTRHYLHFAVLAA